MPTQPLEEWRDVKGYEGLYQVSSLGRVRSCRRQIYSKRCVKFVDSIILTPQVKNTGYIRVYLRKNGKQKYHSVHRLVADAFLTRSVGDTEVNHINEDKSDNRVGNLEWCSKSYNCKFGNRNKKIKANTSRAINQYDMDGIKLLASYNSISDAALAIGIVHSSHISECCNHKRKSAYGFKWVYK